jgi:hypothetical protein
MVVMTCHLYLTDDERNDYKGLASIDVRLKEPEKPADPK